MPRKPPRSTEERLVRAQKSMMPGTLGGRVASAAPMALDVTRLDPRLRANHDPSSAGGGFDPNENPVIIGAGATAGGGSTPSAPASGGVNTVVVGPGATASGGDSSLGGSLVAIGYDANALGDGFTGAIAIGGGSGASAGCSVVGIGANAGYFGGVAVGIGSFSGANSAVAVGGSADVRGTRSVGVGPNVVVHHDYSVGIGTGAATTHINQIMLGTRYEFVEVPGRGVVLVDIDDGTRYLLQIASGALVLNTAP